MPLKNIYQQKIFAWLTINTLKMGEWLALHSYRRHHPPFSLFYVPLSPKSINSCHQWADAALPTIFLRAIASLVVNLAKKWSILAALTELFWILKQNPNWPSESSISYLSFFQAIPYMNLVVLTENTKFTDSTQCINRLHLYHCHFTHSFTLPPTSSLWPQSSLKHVLV